MRRAHLPLLACPDCRHDLVLERIDRETGSAIEVGTLACVSCRRFGCTSRELLTRMGGAGIETRPLWQPMHLSPAHARPEQPPCPVAADLYERAISIPCSVGLTPADQARVIASIVAASTAAASRTERESWQ